LIRQEPHPSHESKNHRGRIVRTDEFENAGVQPLIVRFARLTFMALNDGEGDLCLACFLYAPAIEPVGDKAHTTRRELTLGKAFKDCLECCAARGAEDDEVHGASVPKRSFAGSIPGTHPSKVV